jgi:hypothetical protein
MVVDRTHIHKCMYAHTCDVLMLISYVCLNTAGNQDFIEIIERHECMYAHTCDVFILILYVCLNTEGNQDFIEIIESFWLFIVVVVTTIIFIYAHNLSVPKHQTLFMFGVEQADEFRK